jgi:hypothetical protein
MKSSADIPALPGCGWHAPKLSLGCTDRRSHVAVHEIDIACEPGV